MIAIPFVGTAMLMVGLAMILLPDQFARSTKDRPVLLFGKNWHRLDSIFFGVPFVIGGIVLYAFYLFLLSPE
ncbi:hypothetical protein [Sphingomonas sp. Leaf62]|uniref:hypothetical protein n=1 Tax=Sphingomonas sp. Leaf62 TaxID=1736228 RepID=UPI0006FEF908|nr:hypothetical protein [Sphingomonas sp. Leaf62]KQN71612.1 hypothetical protein ASE91_02430 [Sphingomonas sp. Leaf62]